MCEFNYVFVRSRVYVLSRYMRTFISVLFHTNMFKPICGYQDAGVLRLGSNVLG